MAKRTPPANLGMEYTFNPHDVRRGQTYNPPGFRYTATGRKCDDKYNRLEKGCKAQLTFQQGQPMLRFCQVSGKPGTLVAVNSAEQAVQVGAEGCAGRFPAGATLGRVRRTR